MNEFEILEKQSLNATVTRMVLYAPEIAKHAEPGQFVIVHAKEASERIPLTISDYQRDKGTITLIYQTVGAGTMELDAFGTGEALRDLAGPLGKPTETGGYKSVCVIGGGVGCAIAYPVAKKLYQCGCRVTGITGFRDKELVILRDAFEKVCGEFHLMTDDGSDGEKGLVTQKLSELLREGERFDAVFAIGPLPMMKAVCDLTREENIRTIVSMNPIMIDGTGMCGCCRLTVGGVTRFACVDGPDFDGHLVNFDEAIARTRQYRAQEARAREKACRLMRMEATANE